MARKGVMEGRIMRAKITKRTLQSVGPKDKAFEVVDTELAGFILRVQRLVR